MRLRRLLSFILYLVDDESDDQGRYLSLSLAYTLSTKRRIHLLGSIIPFMNWLSLTWIQELPMYRVMSQQEQIFSAWDRIYFSCFRNHSWAQLDKSIRLKSWIISRLAGEVGFLGDFIKILDLLLLCAGFSFYWVFVLKIWILVLVKFYLTYLKSTDPFCFFVGVDSLSFSTFELNMRQGDSSAFREFFVVFGVASPLSIENELLISMNGASRSAEGAQNIFLRELLRLGVILSGLDLSFSIYR